MGALRAAELHSFGMVGVGSIFEGFRDETLIDDDEVTVLHAAAEDGYRSMSVAMVDIRATLVRALRDRIVDHVVRESLLALAKQRHYSTRSYPQLCEDALAARINREQVEAFRVWSRGHAVQLKKSDALLMLRSLTRWRVEHPEPKMVDFVFEHTDAWRQLTLRFQRTATPEATSDLQCDIIEELRLRPDQYKAAMAAALQRKLALEVAEQRDLQLEPGAVTGTIEVFRRERGLLESDATHQWYVEQELDRAGFNELMERQATIQLVDALAGHSIEAHLIDHLRCAGEYRQAADRARHKRSQLEQRGLEPHALALTDAADNEAQLLDWYFRSVLGREPPEDLERFYKELGYADAFSFKRAVVREACYSADLKMLNNPQLRNTTAHPTEANHV